MRKTPQPSRPLEPARRPRGLLLLASVATALLRPATPALAENIPVVTVDRRVDGASGPVPHVGADNRAGGRKMAEWVVANWARDQGLTVTQNLLKARDGEMALTVEQSPGRQIRTALQLLVARIRDRAEIISSGIEPILIMQDNLAEAARFGEVRPRLRP